AGADGGEVGPDAVAALGILPGVTAAAALGELFADGVFPGRTAGRDLGRRLAAQLRAAAYRHQQRQAGHGDQAARGMAGSEHPFRPDRWRCVLGRYGSMRCIVSMPNSRPAAWQTEHDSWPVGVVFSCACAAASGESWQLVQTAVVGGMKMVSSTLRRSQ